MSHPASGLRNLKWRPRYSTSREDLIADFFEPALDSSVSYDRAVGYFRSSFYSLTGIATARFALRGGRMGRLLCSPELTEEDRARDPRRTRYAARARCCGQARASKPFEERREGFPSSRLTVPPSRPSVPLGSRARSSSVNSGEQRRSGIRPPRKAKRAVAIPVRL